MFLNDIYFNIILFIMVNTNKLFKNNQKLDFQFLLALSPKYRIIAPKTNAPIPKYPVSKGYPTYWPPPITIRTNPIITFIKFIIKLEFPCLIIYSDKLIRLHLV